MQIKYSPQYDDKKIKYEIYGEAITATINGQSDTFDFSKFGDGKIMNIETELSVNPIVSAERIDGELYVELRSFYGENPTQEERFPQWQVIE